MNDKTLELLWVGAFRYHLGRRTYAVSEFCDVLTQNWKDVPEATRYVIQRELEAAFEKDDRIRSNQYPRTNDDGFVVYALGDACDRAAWELVRSLYK